jgi:hypothetical protein
MDKFNYCVNVLSESDFIKFRETIRRKLKKEVVFNEEYSIYKAYYMYKIKDIITEDLFEAEIIIVNRKTNGLLKTGIKLRSSWNKNEFVGFSDGFECFLTYNNSNIR